MFTVLLEFLLYLVPAIPIVILGTILVYLHTIVSIIYQIHKLNLISYTHAVSIAHTNFILVQCFTIQNTYLRFFVGVHTGSPLAVASKKSL